MPLYSQFNDAMIVKAPSDEVVNLELFVVTSYDFKVGDKVSFYLPPSENKVNLSVASPNTSTTGSDQQP